MSGRFELEILAPGKADVFLASAESDIPWMVVEQLDRVGVRVVGELPGIEADEERTRALMCRCSGLVTALPDHAIAGFTARADVAPGTPRLNICSETPDDLDGFVAKVLKDRERIRPYALMIGRLERDFRHARDAIRVAVEGEAGIPCLWADDGRHRTNIESVRERTRLLIKHATFVIADLTLGVESPTRENPSRAHEVGMAIAYERPLMLCSQEPRRYPYFSIGDMQMTFWSTEDELEAGVKSWIRFNREVVACRVYNYQLPAPRIAKTVFSYDPKLRYVGPRTKSRLGVRRWLATLGAKLR